MCFVCVAQSRNGGHIQSSPDAYSGGSFGGYGTAAAGTFTASQYLDTVLTGVSWSAAAGLSASVSYSFDFSAADTSIVYSNNPYTFTEAEKSAARTAMAEISQLVNITFVETSSASANIHFYNGNLTLGGTTTGVAGYYYSGDVFTRATVGMDDGAGGFAKGNWQYVTLLHEIGHAIGLKHAGNYNGTEDGPFLPSQYDTTDYTVMSYYDGANGEATVMRELDIAALQYLYGGSGYYGSTGGSTGTTTGTAGNDALSGTSSGDDIKGGLGSDTISGNDGADTLYGGRAIADSGDAADTISGGTGNDLIYGNTGNDALYGGSGVSSTGDGADTIYGGLGSDTVYGNDGNDFLAGGGGIAHPVDDADTIYGGAGNDSIVGNGGNDWIYADAASEASGDGADTIYGGLGDDVIFAAGGNDVIWGQVGADSMYGGSGADNFYFHTNGGEDVIYDFTSGSDRLMVQSNINSSGLTTAAQIAGNFSVLSGWGYIALGGDHGVWLQNVTSISASDITII